MFVGPTPARKSVAGHALQGDPAPRRSRSARASSAPATLPTTRADYPHHARGYACSARFVAPRRRPGPAGSRLSSPSWWHAPAPPRRRARRPSASTSPTTTTPTTCGPATTSQYRAAFLRMLDYYMAQAEATAGNPPDSRGRFNCDGSLWVWEYEHNTIAGRVRSASSATCATAPSRCRSTPRCCSTARCRPRPCCAACTTRAGSSGARACASRWSWRWRTRRCPAGVASLWAGAGAQYSWSGICGCATQTDAGNRPREIYHFAGPDGAVGVHEVEHAAHGSQQPRRLRRGARPARARWTTSTPTPTFLAALAVGRCRPRSATAGTTCRPPPTRSSTPRCSMSNANRRVIVSNEIDFFEDFLADSRQRRSRPSPGSFGNEWDLLHRLDGRGDRRVQAQRREAAHRRGAGDRRVAARPGVHDRARGGARQRVHGLRAVLRARLDRRRPGRAQRARAQFAARPARATSRATSTALHADALARARRAASRSPPASSATWCSTRCRGRAPTSPTCDVAHAAAAARGRRRHRAPRCRARWCTVGGRPRVRILAQRRAVGRLPRLRGARRRGRELPAVGDRDAAHARQRHLRASRSARAGSITSLVDHKTATASWSTPRRRRSTTSAPARGTVTLESSGPVSTTLRVVAGGTPAHETRVTLYARRRPRRHRGPRHPELREQRRRTPRSFALPGATMRHEEVGMIARVARAAAGRRLRRRERAHRLPDASTTSSTCRRPARGVTVSNWDSPFFQAGNSTHELRSTASTPRDRAPWSACRWTARRSASPNQGGDTPLPRTASRCAPTAPTTRRRRCASRSSTRTRWSRRASPAAPPAPLPATTWSLLALAVARRAAVGAQAGRGGHRRRA